MNVHFWIYSEFPWGILSILASYSIGILCAIFYKNFKNINYKYKIIFFGIMEIMIVYLIVRFYGKIHYNRENKYIFPIIAGILVIIYAYENGIISKILKNFSSLGNLSFSIYLIYPFFIRLLNYLNISPVKKLVCCLYFY